MYFILLSSIFLIIVSISQSFIPYSLLDKRLTLPTILWAKPQPNPPNPSKNMIPHPSDTSNRDSATRGSNKKANKAKAAPQVPEFSRKVIVNQIPSRSLCVYVFSSVCLLVYFLYLCIFPYLSLSLCKIAYLSAHCTYEYVCVCVCNLPFSFLISCKTIIYRRPVLCKLLAKESERIALAARLDIPELIYLAANITLIRDEPTSITVSGKLEAHIKAGQYLDAETIVSDFETLILDNLGGKVFFSFFLFFPDYFLLILS